MELSNGYVCTHIGSLRDLDVIDVARQDDIKMKMREWVQYYESEPRSKILNVISLEFSDTRYVSLNVHVQLNVHVHVHVCTCTCMYNLLYDSTSSLQRSTVANHSQQCALSVVDIMAIFE